MEDFVAIVPKLPQPNTFFAAIFDGHGGDMVSRELKTRFHKVLASQADFSSAALTSAAAGAQKGAPVPEDLSQFGESSSLPSAIRKACLALDRAMLHYAAIQLQEIDSKVGKGEQGKALFRTKGGGPGSAAADAYRKAGSTAVVCLVRGGGGTGKSASVLTVGWVGDSRAVLCRAGTPVELSRDHKANRDDEKARIRAAGGTVDRQGRLYGDIAVSRAFGDLQHKGREIKDILKAGATAKDRADEEYGAEGTLVACPDTIQMVIQPTDEFVVMASDGVWDVMTNEQVCSFVRYHLNQHGDVRKAAAELVDKAIMMGSVDNVSAVVLGFLLDTKA
jgi:serine/threonine protein phosphatase PrpC